jgi:bifunctional N-acetylglucosamine-1-phosphate-uridyltransferase/glucosamine-1-phosphate-acetyltransferase GlmU-like protein
MAALPRLTDCRGDLLVCYGDMPLIKKETYLTLTRSHREAGNVCTILSGTTDLPLPYGRILRHADGGFSAIVEDKDCTPAQRAIAELNSGVYVFDAEALRSVTGRLRPSNAQGEYYLTDAPALMLADGQPVGVCRRELGMEIIGANTPQQLAAVEEAFRAGGAFVD